MKFESSQRSTLGVEWELVLVDPASGSSANQALEIFRRMAGPDGTDNPRLRHEFLQNTVEIVTGVCANVGRAREQIDETLHEVMAHATQLGCRATSMGSHPFDSHHDLVVSPVERYQRVLEKMAFWGRQLFIFGLHTHIGVESAAKVVPIMESVLAHYGELQALSACSPFWNGEDTGYASNRAMLFRQLPSAGIPPHFHSFDELSVEADQMVATGMVAEFTELRWDVRPSPRFGTVELRICDAVSNTSELMSLVALSQCLVEWTSTLLDSGQEPPHSPHWLVAENKWRACRYGLEAELIAGADGPVVPAREAIHSMVTKLESTAERLGCAEELAGVLTMMERGAPYERMRAKVRETAGDLAGVVRMLADETAAGHPL